MNIFTLPVLRSITYIIKLTGSFLNYYISVTVSPDQDCVYSKKYKIKKSSSSINYFLTNETFINQKNKK